MSHIAEKGETHVSPRLTSKMYMFLKAEKGDGDTSNMERTLK